MAKNILIKAAMGLHAGIYRLSKGSVFGALFGMDIIVLTTTGAKSGQPRTVPISVLRDGDTLALVASNGGSETPPGWYFNLKANPRATVEHKGQTRLYQAREATAEERAVLWARLPTQYHKYQAKASRTIPIVLLDPVNSIR